MQTPGGGHYQLVFDGVDPTADVVDVPETSQCDGCGELFFMGESLGELCPDLGPLMDWEGRPW